MPYQKYDAYPCCHSRNRPAFCSSPSAKTCPFSCWARRVFPSGETLILPTSRDSRYKHTTLCKQSRVPKGRPLWKPLFCREAGATRKIAAATLPSKTQAGDIGQPVPGADLCRLLAYMGAYCIAHINRSNLSLPYARCSLGE